MSSSSQPNTVNDKHVQQQSLQNYHRQLARKKNYLNIAKNSYKQAQDLINQLREKILLAKERVNALNSEILNCEDIKKIEELESQKKQYEYSITTAYEKLTPINRRLDELGKNITQLETNISAIIEQKKRTC